MVKTAFDNVKSPENRNALPGLIRKAFHDAGHFDKSSGEVRMGCIQHFLSGINACPQHANLEEAEAVLDAVMNQIPPGMLSMADAVQLLGALAVDELAKDTEAPSLLYNRVRTGRVDPQPDECISDKAMCNNLPAFFHSTSLSRRP
jgi:catalase (peroxidase I)